MKAGEHITIGDRQGTYAPEDSATGAEYRCLGFPDNRSGRVSYSSDLTCGYFYPATIFVTGVRDDGRTSLPHDILESFTRKIADYTRWRRIMPKGYDKGQMTWEAALQYAPDFCPQWYGIDDLIKRRLSSYTIQVDAYHNQVTVYFPPQYQVMVEGIPNVLIDYTVFRMAENQGLILQKEAVLIDGFAEGFVLRGNSSILEDVKMFHDSLKELRKNPDFVFGEEYFYRGEDLPEGDEYEKLSIAWKAGWDFGKAHR